MTLTMAISREVAPTEIGYLIFGTGVFGYAPWWKDADIGNYDDDDNEFLAQPNPTETAGEDDWVRLKVDDPDEAEGSGLTLTKFFTMQQIIDAVELAWRWIPAEAQHDMSEDLGLADAEAADIVLQYAVFGGLVYG